MPLAFFENILIQLKPYTREIALHLLGDPLILTNLASYLDIALKHNFRVMLTTSGFYISRHSHKTLFHPSIKQINISLNSYNKNNSTIEFDKYIRDVFLLCEAKLKENNEIFLNLRVWNLDSNKSENRFNATLFEKLSSYFKIEINGSENIRLAKKIILHFDSYFNWPSLSSNHFSNGTCQGLISHFGILADGRVVPCCLDSHGVIELGNLKNSSLGKILNSKRAADIINGFRQNSAHEELCLKCEYKTRFNDNSLLADM
ncbi:MAG: hypothetical protein QG567_524 [Campylobacterota bacterium]|nr:hypothetical protein [Campylobacterota bacterium]